MHVIDTAVIPWTLVSKSNRPGRVHRKLVHEGSVSPGVGYTADLVQYEGGYGTFSAPRHKHNFDQIRYVVSGDPDFGHYQVASPGQSAFFPAGAAYGPETIEEAEILCDRVAIIDSGIIIALESPDRLIDILLRRGSNARKK